MTLLLCWWLSPAVGGYASLVCGSLSCQREERSHHVSFVGHRDSEGDWHQQPTPPTQTTPGHSGDGLPHQPLRTADLKNGKKKNKKKNEFKYKTHISRKSQTYKGS